MERLSSFLFVAAFLLLSSCGGDKSSQEATVAPGAGASDREKVSYMAQISSPDSLARYICYAALGRSTSGKIDSVSMAQLYALEIYQADDQKIVEFSRAYDETVDNLPLTDAYKLTCMTGVLDDTQMPFDLGLRYGAKAKRDGYKPDQVRKDTSALRKIVDDRFFERFVKAFETAKIN